MNTSKPNFRNALQFETSPYLLSHATNPVDWHPWSEASLKLAKDQDKPIILSVGYSACHWCHVMEHECFENEKIAAYMNAHFISIKVDREERPDLDHIYQNVTQLMNQGGGWPLTVFLTPDLKPFFGGTYFPPEDRYGRPGFPRVLEALHQAYTQDRNNVIENANKMTAAIQQISRGFDGFAPPATQNPNAAASNTLDATGKPGMTLEGLHRVAEKYLSSVDWKNGGLGGQPKFPNTSTLKFLWRFGVKTDFARAVEAVTLSLSKMASGGIFDQLRGGFHRYSVDAEWLVPHFEKMLYDNAELLSLYAEVVETDAANQKKFLSDDERYTFVNILKFTYKYLVDEMLSPLGGFYSTQDADSLDAATGHKHEGAYFVWTATEARTVLQNSGLALDSDTIENTLQYFGISERGNFEGSTQNVLTKNPIKTTPPPKNIDDLRAVLLRHRENTRARPDRDEKILASWNGLLLEALAKTKRAFEAVGESNLAEDVLSKAVKLVAFFEAHLVKPAASNNNAPADAQHELALFAQYKDGQAKGSGFLDDYAFFANGLLELSKSIETKSIETAPQGPGLTPQHCIVLAQRALNYLNRHFADTTTPDSYGYFYTPHGTENLITRTKNFYDQAIPNGNAVAAKVRLVLAAIEGNTVALEGVEKTVAKIFPFLSQSPHGLGELTNLCWLFYLQPATITGPKAILFSASPYVFVKPAAPNDNTHQYVVCHEQTCYAPTEKLDDVWAQLDDVFGL